MPEKTIGFDPNGGPLSVRLSRGEATTGHYAVFLFESNRIDAAMEVPTTQFGSAVQNRHDLPTPPSANNGRVLHAITSVGLLGAEKEFAVSMTVTQGVGDLGTVEDKGTGEGPTKVSELIATLSGAPTGAAAVADVAPVARRGTTPRRSKRPAKTLATMRNEINQRTLSLLQPAKKVARPKKKKVARPKKKKAARPKKKSAAKAKTKKSSRRSTQRKGGRRS